ncbi:MAG: hypothetical protein QOG44_1663 [Acidimicrobiaceae bacterium]|nr:hypothetical protein [Acidimicrobiaceae bacterium]
MTRPAPHSETTTCRQWFKLPESHMDKRFPIFSITAGDAMGCPRCRQNSATWPPTCNLGTYPFKYSRSMQSMSSTT